MADGKKQNNSNYEDRRVAAKENLHNINVTMGWMSVTGKQLGVHKGFGVVTCLGGPRYRTFFPRRIL